MKDQYAKNGACKHYDDPDVRRTTVKGWVEEYGELEHKPDCKCVSCDIDREIADKCEDCGTVEDVVYCECPFRADVYNETVMVYLCDGCHYERCMNI